MTRKKDKDLLFKRLDESDAKVKESIAALQETNEELRKAISNAAQDAERG